jgi:hypothetical protein
MRILITLTALLLLSCSGINNLAGAGGSSETQNGFTVLALLPDGKPAREALVRVRPADYFARTGGVIEDVYSVIDTATDSSGYLTIDSLENGEYYVEINDTQSCAGLFSFTAGADSGSGTDTITLNPYARVSGKIEPSDQYLRYVQVEGMERIVTVLQDGSYHFDDLPEGIYTFRIISEDPQELPLLIDSVKAESGEINVVGYRFSRAIILNTTAEGSDVAEDVISFPVLIRLGGELPVPEDSAVCFTKGDGTPLAHQVESWDQAGGTAVVWVKVDTVKGNDTTLLYMHYGSGSSSYRSGVSEVFDADQFAGVWHLSEVSGNGQDQYKDATSHGRNGSGLNMATGRLSAGIIGSCQEFNGVDGFIQIPGLLDQPASLTISAWINSADSVGEIISIGDNAGIRFSSDSNWVDFYSYYSYGDATSWLPISARVETPESQWHFVAIVIDSDAGQVFLYIDGVLKSQAEMLDALVYNKVGSDTYIGQAFRESCNFEGLIDEVRVCSRARDGAWLKLCFENQRLDQRLVNY